MNSIDRVGEIWYDYGPAIPPKVVDGKLVPQMTPLFEALAAELDKAAPMREFISWLVSLDNDDPNSPGRKDRQTVNLNQIIQKAKDALGE